MLHIKARPNEFLVVTRRGRIKNLGVGASAFLPPGASAVLIPSGKEEACFSMTQESKDGIPLRFKGIAIYRVVDPIAAVTSFDFAGGRGHEQIQNLVAHVCLGELRDLVSHMSLQACIEERKTTLTRTVAEALARIVQPADPAGAGWGVAFDIVQVAQVFIVDDTLRMKLESELLNEVTARSELSDIRMREQIERARLSSIQRLEQESLQTEREKTRIAAEKAQLASALEARRLETRAPVERLKIEQRGQLARLEIDLALLTNELKALEAEGSLSIEHARQALEREILPQKQVPQIAEALSKMFRGANLSLYGSDNALEKTLSPLLALIVQHLKA